MIREYIIKIEDIVALVEKPKGLVRCKDCHFKQGINPENGKVICGENHGTHEPDWFCADGEQEDD